MLEEARLGKRSCPGLATHGRKREERGKKNLLLFKLIGGKARETDTKVIKLRRKDGCESLSYWRA